MVNVNYKIIYFKNIYIFLYVRIFVFLWKYKDEYDIEMFFKGFNLKIYIKSKFF